MTDITIVRLNERVKLVSGAIMNLGGALVAACAYRAFIDQLYDIALVTWTGGALMLIWTGVAALGLLEDEG
jgi:hypothetical protein